MKQMEIYMYKEFTLIFLKEIQSLAQYKKYAKKFKRKHFHNKFQIPLFIYWCIQ